MIRNKQSIRHLLQRRLTSYDRLPQFNTENSVWSHFILNGTNGLTRGKFFFIIFSGRCLAKVATYLKFYWKHQLLPTGAASYIIIWVSISQTVNNVLYSLFFESLSLEIPWICISSFQSSVAKNNRLGLSHKPWN